jgi:two-component system, cell cycle sensor histidine kinase and response regulator CckA
MHAVLDSISDRFFSLDRSWRFTYVNGKAAAFFGLPRVELIGRAIWELFPEFEGGRFHREYAQALESGEPTTFEAESELCPGRWIECRVYPAADGLTVLSQDVTDRRLAAEKVRLSEERLRLAMEAGSLAVWELEFATKRLTLSPELVALHGLAMDTVDSGLEQLLERVHPDDRDSLITTALGAVRTKQGYTLQYRVPQENAQPRWIEARGKVVRNDAGEPLRLTGVSTDITARVYAVEALRASEAYHRALIENGGDLIAVLRTDDEPPYLSPSHTRLLGYSVEELQALGLTGVIHPDDMIGVQAALDQLAGEPGLRQSAELRVRHKDGTWLQVHATATSMVDEPAVRGIVVNSHDVTARRALEKQLLQSQKMEAVGRLAGGIAHDFNNLLTAIRGHARFLAEGADSPEVQRADAEQIVAATDRATDLTRQLLLFSRQQLAPPTIVGMNDVVHEIEQLVQRLVGVDIRIEAILDLDAGRVRVGPGYMQQVLMNLIMNARDAMEDDGRITIRTRNVDYDEPVAGPQDTIEAGRYVMMSVADTGSGIPPAILPRIFEPFFTTKPAGVGSGLGLSTVYGIVNQCGGVVRVYSEPGEGTVFRILLPRVDETPASIAPARHEPARGGSETVLVVEDDGAVRALICRILKARGYIVHEAADGLQALDHLEDHTPDLVLSDVVMPGMSGRQLREAVRAMVPGLRFLFMSGYTADEVLRRGIRDAEVAFIEKPFSASGLAAAVRTALDDIREPEADQPAPTVRPPEIGRPSDRPVGLTVDGLVGPMDLPQP